MPSDRNGTGIPCARRKTIDAAGRNEQSSTIAGELIECLMPSNYREKSEQAMLFSVDVWDANCPQHIPQRLAAGEVAKALQSRDQKIAELEAEIRRLKAIQ